MYIHKNSKTVTMEVGIR